MDLSQFLLALRSRRKAFMLALVATIIAALAVAFIMPKKYVGQATLIVDSRDEQTIVPSRGGISITARAAYVATQIELIQSGRVATQVARDLNLAQTPELREMWQDDTGGLGAIDVWIGDQLLQKLKVNNTASNLITIEYSNKSPQIAAKIANGFAKAYLDVALELRNQPVREASQWFEEQLGGMRNQVTQAQNKLTAFQKQKGILVADEHLDIETTRLNELNTQMLAARTAFYDAQSKFKQASELLASGGSPDAMADVLASPAVAAVKLDLARAESLLQTASTDLGQNHPVYMKYASDVKALREKLASEMKKVVATLRNAMEQAQKREQEIKTAVDAQQARIMQSKGVRVELASMTRDVESAQRNYDTVLTRAMSTRLESRARQGDVQLLTPAIEPTLPAQPRIPLVAALSVVLGLLIAVGMVYLLETVDRRVRSRADLEARLAVPSLGRLSKWQPTGGRLLAAPRPAARALPHPF